MMTNEPLRSPASFRDPSGFIWEKEGKIFRQVNVAYKDHYDLIMSSGLFTRLTENKLLVKHVEVLPNTADPACYKVLQPEPIPFISYPYEWCFSQLQDAALATLEIQKEALHHGMTLKDASAYNIQFLEGKPILIDTLSFEEYEAGAPWIAYQQFCQHFLAPLALLALTDIHLGTLSQVHLDGIPLNLAAKLLPTRARFSFGLGIHLFLHARSQEKHAANAQKQTLVLPKHQLLGIIESLITTVRRLRPPKQKTVWGTYYQNTNYTAPGLKDKESIIQRWVSELHPESVWDMGANDGHFGRLASKQGIPTIASDFDPLAIEHAYAQMKKEQDGSILPLVINVTNPSPSIGWMNKERESFLHRASFDLTLCLALLHHITITNNVPFSLMSSLLARQTKMLIIEFVPREDSNTQRLLAHHSNDFPDYERPIFEQTFSDHFEILKQVRVKESTRILYLMKRKETK